MGWEGEAWEPPHQVLNIRVTGHTPTLRLDSCALHSSCPVGLAQGSS